MNNENFFLKLLRIHWELRNLLIVITFDLFV
jgi:hypothetical protein